VSSLARTPSRRKPVDKTADQTARSPTQVSVECWNVRPLSVSDAYRYRQALLREPAERAARLSWERRVSATATV
jgi:hypothetical protein